MTYGLLSDIEDQPGELWKAVVGFEGRYEVSNLGRIKSLPNSRRFAPIILRQQPHVRTGYLTVNLTTHDGIKWRQIRLWVARLVCEAFHGPCPPGLEACHGDGDKLNNAEANIRWDTPVANQADRELHGTANIGSQNPSARLDEAAVRSIKLRLKSGDKPASIAGDFRVAVTTIKAIKNGQNWTHIHV